MTKTAFILSVLASRGVPVSGLAAAPSVLAQYKTVVAKTDAEFEAVQRLFEEFTAALADARKGA